MGGSQVVISPLAVLLLALIVGWFGLGLWLVVTAGRARNGSAPICGHCGYNLTALEGNRCPECGKLFIEAGVSMGGKGNRRRRRAIGITMVASPLLLCLLMSALEGISKRARSRSVRPARTTLPAAATPAIATAAAPGAVPTDDRVEEAGSTEGTDL